MTDKTLRTGWQLLVRVEIDKSRRVQCQCRGCGKTVYADVHLVQWPDGEIACWGSRCFEREMGIVGKELQAVYSRVNGRKLTDAERDLLDANREALIAQIKGIEEEIAQAEKRREKAFNTVRHIKAKPVGLPELLPENDQKAAPQPQTTAPPKRKPSVPINYQERSHKYTILFRNQKGEIVKQLFRGNEQFCRSFIDREIDNYPPGTEGEIIVTKTGRSLYQRVASNKR